MTDGEYSLLMLLALLAGVVIYLLALVRSQRKTIAVLSASEPKAAESAPGEVEALRERVKVLERITVDKENSLSREIDELGRG